MNLLRTNVTLLVLLVLLVAAALAMRVNPTKPNWELMPDMQYSPAYDAFSVNENFPNGQTMQPQPVGTIAQGQVNYHYQATKEDAIRAGEELMSPLPAEDPAALARGAEVYRVNCLMCHGPEGMGDGAVAQRSYLRPLPLPTGSASKMKDGQLFHILTYGQGAMLPFANQLSPIDRWNVIAYVRDMQHSAAAAAAPDEPAPAIEAPPQPELDPIDPSAETTP